MKQHKKDWVGGGSVVKMLGASNLCEDERQEHDYYATDPEVVKMLLELESFKKVLEPSCGEGHISKVLIDAGIKTKSSDLIDRNFGVVKDFFTYEKWKGDIVTNPPYSMAKEFIEHSLSIIPKGRKVAMLLKLQFLEGQKRRELFAKYPPQTVYVSSKRITCAKNGDFDGVGSSAIAYAWFVWVRGNTKAPKIKWFN